MFPFTVTLYTPHTQPFSLLYPNGTQKDYEYMLEVAKGRSPMPKVLGSENSISFLSVFGESILAMRVDKGLYPLVD